MKRKIIHKVIHKRSGLIKEIRYLCNQAMSITFDKCTYDWEAVTCKNCIKQK